MTAGTPKEAWGRSDGSFSTRPRVVDGKDFPTSWLEIPGRLESSANKVLWRSPSQLLRVQRFQRTAAIDRAEGS